MLIDTEESTTVGSRLEVEGVYLLMVTHTEEQAEKRDKSGYLDGFGIDVEVLAGPQKGMTADHVFYNPKLSSEVKAQETCRRLQTRFLECVGLITPEQKGKKGVQIELAQARGRMFIGKFKKNDKGYLEMGFGRFWHIDDPSAEPCERDHKAIEMLAKAYRRKPESFGVNPAGAAGATNGNGTNGNGQHKQTAPPVDPNEL